MKKFNCLFLFFIFVLLGITLSDCRGFSEEEKQLINQALRLNEKCPINYGLIGDINNVSVKDGCIVFNYVLTESFKNRAWGNKEVFDENTAYYDLAICESFNSQDEELLDLVIHAFTLGYKVRYSYNFTFENGLKVNVAENILDPRKYKSIIDRFDLTEIAEMELLNRAEVENKFYKQNPHNNSHTIASFSRIDDDFYVIGSIVKEEPLKNVMLSSENMKEGLSKSFNDPNMIVFAKACIAGNKGISFRYISETGNDSLIIDFSREDLMERIGIKQNTKPSTTKDDIFQPNQKFNL